MVLLSRAWLMRAAVGCLVALLLVSAQTATQGPGGRGWGTTRIPSWGREGGIRSVGTVCHTGPPASFDRQASCLLPVETLHTISEAERKRIFLDNGSGSARDYYNKYTKDWLVADGQLGLSSPAPERSSEEQFPYELAGFASTIQHSLQPVSADRLAPPPMTQYTDIPCVWAAAAYVALPALRLVVSRDHAGDPVLHRCRPTLASRVPL